jgi:hypothetical protein
MKYTLRKIIAPFIIAISFCATAQAATPPPTEEEMKDIQSDIQVIIDDYIPKAMVIMVRDNPEAAKQLEQMRENTTAILNSDVVFEKLLKYWREEAKLPEENIWSAVAKQKLMLAMEGQEFNVNGVHPPAYRERVREVMEDPGFGQYYFRYSQWQKVWYEQVMGPAGDGLTKVQETLDAAEPPLTAEESAKMDAYIDELVQDFITPGLEMAGDNEEALKVVEEVEAEYRKALTTEALTPYIVRFKRAQWEHPEMVELMAKAQKMVAGKIPMGFTPEEQKVLETDEYIVFAYAHERYYDNVGPVLQFVSMFVMQPLLQKFHSILQAAEVAEAE